MSAGIKLAQLKPPSEQVIGYGGVVDVSTEEAILDLEHSDGLTTDSVAIELEIAPRQAAGVPSVLGRDVLQRYRLTFSPSERIVRLEYPA